MVVFSQKKRVDLQEIFSRAPVLASLWVISITVLRRDWPIKDRDVWKSVRTVRNGRQCI